MSNVDKEYYEYLNKLNKEDLIEQLMNAEMQKSKMPIMTKYNINDTVYYLDILRKPNGEIVQDNGVQTTIIRQIVVLEYDYYYVTDDGNFREFELSANKQEAEEKKNKLEELREVLK